MFSLHIDTARTWRGGQNQALLTVLGLRERGHRTVLMAHPEGELCRRAAEGHDLIKLAPKTESDLPAAWRLSRILRDLQPQIVHAHDPHGVAIAALALQMSTAPPRPRLVAARRVDFHIRGNTFSRWKYRNVDCFIAASAAIAEMLVEDGIPASRVRTVHEGIDVDRILHMAAADVHQEYWLPKDAPVVGNIAALVPHKGQRHLVDSAALVVREMPDVRFLIFGAGELHESLAHHIKELGLERHVLLAGFRPDVLAFLKTFDLFVMSSVTEGLGTSLLDAMAAWRAVVATRVGGIPEVVEDGKTGLLVPARDHHLMAEAIVRLLRHPEERRRMGLAGLHRVREKFSAGRMVSDTVRVYESLQSSS
jgi:glycosyltransferase involved in cell wall biosynthesis